MTAVILAALAGISYGASDFSGALASKDDDATLVTAAMQVVSLLTLLIALVFISGTITVPDLLWGAVGGLAIAVALTTFYRALALGPIATAAAITGLIGSALPVLTGLLLGEIPSTLTLVGIGLAVPAAVLVSVGGMGIRGAASITHSPRERVVSARQTNQTRALAVVAGIGFGVFFIALSRTSEDGGLFPLLGARAASIAGLAIVLTATKTWAPLSKAAWPAVAIAGVLDMAANSLYLTALKFGSFTWVAALTSLYPVSTVVLARIVLKEKLAPGQVVGLVMAGGALLLVAVGN